MQSKKGRFEYNQFLIEGEKFVEEIPKDYKIEFYLVSETFASKNSIIKYENKATVHLVKDEIYKLVTETISPQGILAVCNIKKYSVDNLSFDNSFILIAESLQDPGNLGTLIRTSDAAGVDAIILSKGTTDLYNPKVIRATAGSIFHLPIIEEADLSEIIKLLKQNDVKILAAHLQGKNYPYEIDLVQKIAIIIGNEGKGISNQISSEADFLVKIPMIGRAESLNASIASGVLLYEAVRQRMRII